MDVGVNFRATAGYVTDGAGQTYCTADSYPVTRGGATFGWETAGIDTRDRNNAIDVRLAGINFTGAGGDSWRIDLTATGSYDIRLALGDASNAQTITCEVYDNATLKATISGTTSGALRWFDATGVERTDVTWPTSNAAITHTFASTILRLKHGAGTLFAAHAQVATGGSPPPPSVFAGAIYHHLLAGGNAT